LNIKIIIKTKEFIMVNTKIQVKIFQGKKRYCVAAANKEVYLTDKEAGIISCLVEGLRPKEIAWELTTSLNTVNTHLANIKIKLGCVSIFQLGLVLGNIIATDGSIFLNKSSVSSSDVSNKN
jgi:DNA-binding CsgD family transcriptional regulator